MTRRIFWSILVACLSVLMVGMTGVIWTTYQTINQEETQLLLSQAHMAADLLNASQSVPPASVSFSGVRLSLIAPDGTVTYDSSLNPGAMGNHSQRAEIEQAREEGTGFASRYSDTLSEETYNAAVRLNDGSFVRLSQTHASLLLLLARALAPALLFIGFAVLLSAWLAHVLSRQIVEPINAIDPREPLKTCPYEQLLPLQLSLESYQRQVKEQLDELDRRAREFSLLARYMDEGLLLISETGRIVSVNRAASALFEVAEGEEAAKNPRLEKLLQQASEKRKASQLVHRNGGSWILEAAAIRHDGQNEGWLVLALDITEKQEARQRRQEFTANVTHELKTPLQTILSSAELLETGIAAPEDTARFAGYIHQEAERMTRMINDIIHLSRLENVDLPARQCLDLYALSQKTAEELRSSAEVAGLALTMEGKSAYVEALPDEAEDIVRNLLENAIRYNVPGGRVVLRVEPQEREVKLVVEDTGIGIAKEEQTRIFERFYTADPAHTRTKGGTGLGLAIVLHAVQNLQGTIRVESEPGKGSRFIITLPRCDHS